MFYYFCYNDYHPMYNLCRDWRWVKANSLCQLDMWGPSQLILMAENPNNVLIFYDAALILRANPHPQCTSGFLYCFIRSKAHILNVEEEQGKWRQDQSKNTKKTRGENQRFKMQRKTFTLAKIPRNYHDFRSDFQFTYWIPTCLHTCEWK